MSSAALRIILSRSLTGFILWYGVEKLFQQSIGFTTFTISLVAIAYIGISAVCNVPTGILSDKYGRKTVLIGASLLLLLSTIVGGLAHSPAVYVISAILWGLFYTTQNGAYESVLYDTLKAEGRHKEYARYSGLSNAGFWFMVFVSSVVGAWVGSHFGLRAAFWVTVIPNVINLLVVLTLPEPHRDKSEHHSSRAMAAASLQTLLASPAIVATASVYLLLGILGWTLNEFDQLFLIDLGLGVFLVGLFNGLSALSQSFGGVVGHRLSHISTRRSLAVLTVLFATAFLLPVHYRWLAIGMFLGTVFFRNVFQIRNDAELQHQLPSSIRNTTISSLGIVNDVIVVFAYLLFGMVGQILDSRAAYLAVGVYGAVLLLMAGVYIKLRRFQPLARV